MSIQEKMCEVTMFQLQSISNATRCIDHRFAIKNYGISCLALLFNLSDDLRTTILHAKKTGAGCEIQRVIYSFFLKIDMNLWLLGQGESK